MVQDYKYAICNTLSHILSNYVLTVIGSLQLYELDYGMIVAKHNSKIWGIKFSENVLSVYMYLICVTWKTRL